MREPEWQCVEAALWRGDAVTFGPDEVDEGHSWLRADLQAACAELSIDGWASRPIRIAGEVVGAVATSPDDRLTVPYLAPAARGRGLGDAVLEELDGRGAQLLAPDGSELAEYAVARGFLPTSRRGRRVELLPPSLRTDLRPAASVCLFAPGLDRVLLGQRATPPWLNYWAFPGGTREAGESLEETARRELLEETGIRLAASDRPVAAHTVSVGSGDGRKAYRITNFAFVLDSAPMPRDTEELAARWLDWKSARRQRPMAAGTRRVLRKVSVVRRRIAGRTAIPVR